MKKILSISIFSLTLSLLSWAQSPQPQRDPFLDLSARTAVTPVVPAENPQPPVETPRQPVVQNVTHVAAKELPKIGVKGILTSPAGHRAILSSADHTVIVQKGDQLGGYRVASIDRDGVTLQSKNHKYRCLIEKL